MSQSLSPTPDPAPKGNLSWLPTREDMSLIFESSGEAMFVTDRDGRILSLNPVARRFVGRHHDVIGTMFHNLVGCLFSREGDDRGCPLAHISGSEPMGRRLRLLRRSGPGVEAWSVSVPWLSVAT
jgi:PAS domain-containing protein